MQTDDLIRQIAREDFDILYFSKAALNEKNLRDELIHQMMTHPHILVYYHCFYAVEKACREVPQLFYPYWNDLASMLGHTNSYQRDFGLILIGLLVRSDEEKRIDGVLPMYLSHACDAKFMTARCCVQNCARIIQARPDLSAEIIFTLLEYESHDRYSESQNALLKYDFLEILDQVYPLNSPNENITQFILAAAVCKSPKTRKRAKELIEKFQLSKSDDYIQSGKK